MKKYRIISLTSQYVSREWSSNSQYRNIADGTLGDDYVYYDGTMFRWVSRDGRTKESGEASKSHTDSRDGVEYMLTFYGSVPVEDGLKLSLSFHCDPNPIA